VDTLANLRQQSKIQEQHSVPTPAPAAPRPRPSPPSVFWTLTFEGAWIDKPSVMSAEIDYRFEYRGLWPQESSEDGEPLMRDYTWSMSQSVVQASGAPVILVKYRPDSADGSVAMVTVLRLEATRLDPTGQPMASAPVPDQIHMEIVDQNAQVTNDEISGIPKETSLTAAPEQRRRRDRARRR
jgi:hypothetical protein